MSHQMHHVPGRLRVRVPAIKKSTQNAAPVITLLCAVRGVSSAEPNLMTGSVVIRYDPASTSAASILTALSGGGYFHPDPPASRPVESAVVVRIRNKVATALFWYCLEKAVERSIPLMLAAVL